MAIATSYSELRKMSKGELIRIYDGHVGNTVLGLGFFRDEIARRDAEEETSKIIAMTRQMRSFTIVITILTVVNVILVAMSLLR